jgi:(p)ppGpp synthase/HD superfamily hydrolase
MKDLNYWQHKFTPCKYSEKLLDKIILLNEKTTNKVSLQKIRKAIYYAKKYHGNQKRDSGEPFYSHPLAVASMVADYCFETDILITSILHDTLEDTELTFEELEVIFNSDIAKQVNELTRIKFDRKFSVDDIVYSLWVNKNSKLLLVKLFDRLHNLKTVGAKPKNKIKKTLNETINIFLIVSLYLENPAIAEEIRQICLDYLAIVEAKHNISREKLFIRENFNDNYQLPSLEIENDLNNR